MELVYSNVCGPSSLLSRYGFRYYVCFIDAYSRYTCIYLLVNKSQVFSAFQQYKALIENFTGYSIKALQTNNGYLSHAITQFLLQHGIIHRLSYLYTHQENGKIERKHRHITETGFALLATAFLPLEF